MGRGGAAVDRAGRVFAALPSPPSAPSAGAPRIASPRDGARFLIDPGRPLALQTVAVRVAAPAGASRVRIRVDGRVVGDVGAPYVVRWPLAPGEHQIVAEAPGGAPSEAVRVRVD